MTDAELIFLLLYFQFCLYAETVMSALLHRHHTGIKETSDLFQKSVDYHFLHVFSLKMPSLNYFRGQKINETKKIFQNYLRRYKIIQANIIFQS